ISFTLRAPTRTMTFPYTTLFRSEEDIVLPDGVISVGDLLNWLKERDEGYANALQHPQTIRVAINQEHADHDEPVAGAREIALFRSEEHTSELQSRENLVCRLLLE